MARRGTDDEREARRIDALISLTVADDGAPLGGPNLTALRAVFRAGMAYQVGRGAAKPPSPRHPKEGRA